MTNSDTIAYDRWLPIEEVMAKTGMSRRTIYRKVETGELRQATRPFPGRKPLPVFDPEPVAELVAAVLKAKPQILPPVTTDLAMAPRRHDDMTRIGQNAIAKPVTVTAPFDDAMPIFLPPSELRFKVYLSAKEAVFYTGVRYAQLRQIVSWVNQGPRGSLICRRADLDALKLE